MKNEKLQKWQGWHSTAGETAGYLQAIENMAERVGFEPTLPFRVNTLSKRAPSATRPSLRLKPGKGDSPGRLSHCTMSAGIHTDLA